MEVAGLVILSLPRLGGAPLTDYPRRGDYMKLDPSIINLAIALAPWATILALALALIFQKELSRGLESIFKTRKDSLHYRTLFFC